MDADHILEVEVAADGALLEIEETVREREVPAAVLQAVQELLPGATERVYERKMIVIDEVDATVDGREREVLIFPTGRVLEGHD